MVWEVRGAVQITMHGGGVINFDMDTVWGKPLHAFHSFTSGSLQVFS